MEVFYLRENTYSTIKNEVTSETVTLIEQNEQYELLEYTFPPNSESITHFHQYFTEEIKVLNGTLKIDLGHAEKLLYKGDQFTIQKGVNHSLANFSNKTPLTIQVKITPVYPVFEATKVLFGLAKDGLVDEKGVPNNRTDLAIVYDMLDLRIHLPRILNLFMKYLIRKGKKKGIDQQLINRYARVDASEEEANETFIRRKNF